METVYFITDTNASATFKPSTFDEIKTKGTADMICRCWNNNNKRSGVVTRYEVRSCEIPTDVYNDMKRDYKLRCWR